MMWSDVDISKGNLSVCLDFLYSSSVIFFIYIFKRHTAAAYSLLPLQPTLRTDLIPNTENTKHLCSNKIKCIKKAKKKNQLKPKSYMTTN